MTDNRELPEDPLDIPMFREHSDSAQPTGRVRSTWRFPNPDAAALPSAESVPISQAWVPPLVSLKRIAAAQQDRTTGVDWTLVAGLRVQASERLSALMSGTSWDKEEQHRQGWAVIRQLLDEDTADALASGREVRSPAEQEAVGQAVFDAVFRLGRLQPLVDDPDIENILCF